MLVIEKIFATMMALGFLLAFPAVFISETLVCIFLAVGLIGAIGICLRIIWGNS